MSLRAAAVVLLLPLVLLAPAYAQPASTLSSGERAAVIEQIDEMLTARYVFADLGAEAGAHVRARRLDGAYDDLADPDAFAEALTADLQHVTNDKHLRVRHRPPPSGAPDQRDLLGEHVSWLERTRANPYGIAAVERLDGNIGYLDLRFFPPEEDARDAYDAAMHLLADVDALIVDERRHGGGNPSAIRYLTSYFFDEPTHLNSLHWREGDTEIIEEFWTYDEVAGPQRPDLPLFVLTSDYTFSGAEEFAYNLQTRDRATIVGETSGGGANPGGTLRVGDRFTVFVPSGRAVNPITGTNWEGVGVEPDVVVSADQALDKAIELARPAAAAYEQARERRVEATVQQIRALLDRASERFAVGEDGTKHVHDALREGLEAGLLDEYVINAFGYEHLGTDHHALATAIFRFNVATFPDSWNVYDSLGEAYAAQGERDRAREAYREARERAPDDQHERIDEILSGL